MTKAERIFRETRYQCLMDIKKRGYEESGYHTVIDRKETAISTRTMNDLDKIYDRAVRDLVMDYKLGVLDKENATLEAQTLRKVRITLDNARKNLCR